MVLIKTECISGAISSERPDVTQTIEAHNGDVSRVCDKMIVFINTQDNVSTRDQIFCHLLNMQSSVREQT